MKEETVKCPKCGCEISLSKAYAAAIRTEMEADIEARIQTRTESELKQLKDRIEGDYAAKEKSLKNQIAQADTWMKEAREREEKLIDRSRQLEKEKLELDLEVARRTEEAKKNIEKECLERAGLKYNLELKGREKTISDLSKKIRELEQQATLGSQQRQGSTFQESVDEMLRQGFPQDEIVLVSAGKKGADIIQRVNGRIGETAGVVLWECKWTRNWQDEWIGKLKEDGRRENADELVLVSTILRKDLTDIGMVEGIMVIDPIFVVPIAELLRSHIIGLSRSKVSSINRAEKKEMMYEFVTSRQFQDAARAMADTLKVLRDSLEDERKAMERIWKSREIQVRRAANAFIDIYGPIRGLTGTSLASILELELSPEPKALLDHNSKLGNVTNKEEPQE
jgi:hypothetical protein